MERYLEDDAFLEENREKGGMGCVARDVGHFEVRFQWHFLL